MTEDRIEEPSPTTEKAESSKPWRTIGPDEVTVRCPADDPRQPTCAELIRMMTAGYDEQRPLGRSAESTPLD